MSVFGRFHPLLQTSIVQRLGWSSLREVQEQAGAAILDGHNAVVLAPTAGGKTEASLFPLLSELLTEPEPGLGVLYLAPIKALLNNQAKRLATYTHMVGLDRMVWHGDITAGPRRKFLNEPVELLMTTPESLEVMLISPRVDAAKLFRSVRAVVIDEVHALAGSDRGAHLMSVLERINSLAKRDIQRIGLSATVGNPDAILAWLRGSSQRPGSVINPPAPKARRELLITWREDQQAIARDAAVLAKGKKSLFFCQSRSTTETVAQTMRRAGTEVFVHHSSVSKEERMEAEERFHEGSNACIVCTSTLELGIDVGDLDSVLQNEAPSTVGSFLQRMGRTGRRAGSVANTTFLCESEAAVLQAVALIELARKGWVEDVPVQDRCWPVLVHQLLAMALADAGVEQDAAWQQLSRVPDFAGVTRAEFDRLIRWMLRDQSLVKVSGRLALGPKAERKFGRRNFMEIYAVFESPQTYSVVLQASKRPIGSLAQDFVDRLVEGASSFVLGGRGWQCVSIDHKGREIQVLPAPRGRQPSWGGFVPLFLGYHLCRAIRDVLIGTERSPFLHPSAAEIVDQSRESFDGVLGLGRFDLEESEGEHRWWTFAGGRINNTLRAALASRRADWKVLADNFSVKVRGASSLEEVSATISELQDPELWEDEALWQGIAKELPSYRLSKFQSLLPPWAERELLADYLLDLEGAWRMCGGQAAILAPRFGGVTGDEPVPKVEVTRVLEGAYQPERPIRWVRSDLGLAELCAELSTEPMVALDVETTIRDHRLCLVQLGTKEANYLVDPFEIEDFGPLAELLGSPKVVKVIHNASFEKRVLGRVGIQIENVYDTLEASRKLRSVKGHGLAKVCERELGIVIDKQEQVSNWRQRPLSASQEAYAAVDVEVLVRLYAVFGAESLL